MDKTNPIDHPRTYAALMEASDADGAHEVCELCAKLEEENAQLREAGDYLVKCVKLAGAQPNSMADLMCQKWESAKSDCIAQRLSSAMSTSTGHTKHQRDKCAHSL